jgi:hypothetical protein
LKVYRNLTPDLNSIRGDLILSNEDWELGINEFFVRNFSKRKNIKRLKRKLSMHPNVRNEIEDFENKFNDTEYLFDRDFSQENSYDGFLYDC